MLDESKLFEFYNPDICLFFMYLTCELSFILVFVIKTTSLVLCSFADASGPYHMYCILGHYESASKSYYLSK